MAFNELAPEILSIILRSVDSLPQLHALISASAPCYRVFVGKSERILSSLLQNFVPNGLMSDAVVAITLPAPNQPRPSRQLRREILHRYLQNDQFELPRQKQSLVDMCRLHTQISTLIEAYAKRAVHSLNEITTKTCDRISLSALSETEYHRFYRSFLRYEIYCRLFPCLWKSHPTIKYSATRQHQEFLSFLTTLQLEEIRCVFHFIASISDEAVDELEKTVERKISHCPGVQTGTPTAEQLEESKSRGTDEELVPFKDLSRGALDLFSFTNKSLGSQKIWYLASLGVSFVYNLMKGNTEERRSLIRENTPYCRTFFYEAWKRTHIYRTEPEGLRDVLLPNPHVTWFTYRRADTSWALCERAYLLWDAEKLRSKEYHFRLALAVDMPRDDVRWPLMRKHRETLEERLSNIWLPKKEMRKIEAEYGSIKPPEVWE